MVKPGTKNYFSCYSFLHFLFFCSVWGIPNMKKKDKIRFFSFVSRCVFWLPWYVRPNLTRKTYYWFPLQVQDASFSFLSRCELTWNMIRLSGFPLSYAPAWNNFPSYSVDFSSMTGGISLEFFFLGGNQFGGESGLSSHFCFSAFLLLSQKLHSKRRGGGQCRGRANGFRQFRDGRFHRSVIFPSKIQKIFLRTIF